MIAFIIVLFALSISAFILMRDAFTQINAWNLKSLPNWLSILLKISLKLIIGCFIVAGAISTYLVFLIFSYTPKKK